jgi:hypothetical protein
MLVIVCTGRGRWPKLKETHGEERDVTREEPDRLGPVRDRRDDSHEPCIEDLFDYGEDAVDFMSAESFPASDPPPPQIEPE